MKQTMKIGMVLLGAVTIAMWFGISSTNKKKEDLELALTGMEKEMVRQESAFEEVLDLILDVESQIGEIVEKENLLYHETQAPLNKNRKELLLKEIDLIDGLIGQSKVSINQLSDKLKSADLKMGVFQKRINSLQADLFDRQAVIKELKSEIGVKDQAIALMINQADSLSTELNVTTVALGQKDLEVKQLTALNDELNKGYLAIGTFEELKARGVVDKEGGFLGFLGRSIALIQDAKEELFMELDRRELKQLKIEGEELSLISDHPSESYSILPSDDDNVKILEINDPEAFWQISKYLVISKKS